MFNPSKIKGSFIGALAGDCIGRIFEWKTDVKNELAAADYCREVGEFVRGLPILVPRLPLLYSDDTAMAKSVAKSLIECQEFDGKHMAKLFCDSYFAQPNRGYGRAPPVLFKRFREDNYADVYGPAKNLFDGRGSVGNGGAMRVFPVALFYSQNFAEALRDIQDPILRTIGFAVSLNGDTDTIASMAAAVSGAFYGNTLKDEIWKGVFEGYDEYVNLSDALVSHTAGTVV